MEVNLQAVLERIKLKKKFLKLTNEDLASKADLPKGTLSKILSGETKDPKVTTLVAIADALDVSVNFLVYGKEASSQDVVLMDNEQNHIKKYRALDERGQRTVDTVLNNLYEIVVAKNESSVSYTPSQRLLEVADGKGSYKIPAGLTREDMHRLFDEELDAIEKGEPSLPFTTINGSKDKKINNMDM